MITYLLLGLGQKLGPMLERKGAKVKAKLKAERKRRESDSQDH